MEIDEIKKIKRLYHRREMNVGDKIVCIDNSGVSLTLNKVYIVNKINEFNLTKNLKTFNV